MNHDAHVTLYKIHFFRKYFPINIFLALLSLSLLIGIFIGSTLSDLNDSSCTELLKRVSTSDEKQLKH